MFDILHAISDMQNYNFQLPPNIPKNLHSRGKFFWKVRGELEYFMSAFLIYCMLY